MTAAEKKAERIAALETLRAMLPPGSTVHTILRHVSSSGMTRAISPVVCDDGSPHDITYLVVRAVEGFSFDQKWGGIRMGGAGMDMGFSLVYTLSSVLYPDGHECIGDGPEYRDRCPSNDHSNGDRDYTPHHHSDGGYALRHDWL